MIQRIQSILLLLAGVCCFSLFGLDFASAPTEGVATASLFSDGVYNIMDHPVLMGLFALAGVLAVAAIFLYNNRTLQARISTITFIFALIGVILSIIFLMQDSVSGESINDGLAIYPAIIALILPLVAVRFIRKDDKLVKSMDRLR